MADDRREKRGLIAKWREHRTHEAEPSGQAAERVALKAEERARLQQARDIADVEIRGAGRRTRQP